MVNLDTYERLMCIEIRSAKKDGRAGPGTLWPDGSMGWDGDVLCRRLLFTLVKVLLLQY